jgi:hypothetical protein
MSLFCYKLPGLSSGTWIFEIKKFAVLRMRSGFRQKAAFFNSLSLRRSAKTPLGIFSVALRTVEVLTRLANERSD